MKLPTFTRSADFDFTKLSNYIAPENTLARPEWTWLNAPSSFYLPMQEIISQEACERRRPEEMEFKRVHDNTMSDIVHDAIRQVLFYPTLLPESLAEAAQVVETHGASHFFWLSTIIHGRHGSAAYVKNNTFYTL